MNDNQPASPAQGNLSPAWEGEYVGWMRFVHIGATDGMQLRICNSDDLGAFKVYRASTFTAATASLQAENERLKEQLAVTAPQVLADIQSMGEKAGWCTSCQRLQAELAEAREEIRRLDKMLNPNRKYFETYAHLESEIERLRGALAEINAKAQDLNFTCVDPMQIAIGMGTIEGMAFRALRSPVKEKA